MRWVLLFPIRIYQYAVSPFIAPHCRHIPCCSEYAITAINQHGAVRGLWLALRRFARCHPWGSSGYDPVPDPDSGSCTDTHSCNRTQ